MFVLIGCPVYKREWVLPYWFDAIEKQTVPLNNLGFVFEASPDDDETLNVLFDWQAAHPQVRCFDVVLNSTENHQTHPEGVRTWTSLKYYTMVTLRNNLLERVVSHSPDRYFSLDSDILLENPDTIQRLYDATEEDFDAVNPLMFMTPVGTFFPSVMTWVEGEHRAQRLGYPLGTTFEADVIMAAVMMNRHTYTNVRYRWHRQGEDLGWSAECRRAGLRLGCVSDVYAPHIMSQQMMQEYLDSGDPRSSYRLPSGVQGSDIRGNALIV